MRILLTNDDGINAQGLSQLWALVNKLPDIDEVWVVAPKHNQSHIGTAISYNKPLHIEELNETTFSVEGTPTDCMIIALNWLMKDKPPDLIIAGINEGTNFWYINSSGTVAAARRANLEGKNAIAINQPTLNQGYGEDTVVIDLLQKCINDVSSINPYLLNINLPNTEEIKGIKYLKQAAYPNSIDITLIENNLIFAKDRKAFPPSAIDEGYITVSPLTNDSTDYALLKILNDSALV